MTERRSRARARALAAGVVAGLALWCTRGGLEVVAGPAGPLRVALLPSGWQALSLIAAMAGARARPGARGGLGRRRRRPRHHRRRRRRRPPALRHGRAGPAVPAVARRRLAGAHRPRRPLRARRLVRRRARSRCARRGCGSRRRAASTATIFAGAAPAVALAGLLLYGGVAWRFAGTGLFPGGDEPHYLVLAQSLWRDHDFKIENNHARGDTFEYYRLPLAAALPRARPRRRDLLDPSGRPGAARGADLRGGRLLRRRRLPGRLRGRRPAPDSGSPRSG